MFARRRPDGASVLSPLRRVEKRSLIEAAGQVISSALLFKVIGPAPGSGAAGGRPLGVAGCRAWPRARAAGRTRASGHERRPARRATGARARWSADGVSAPVSWAPVPAAATRASAQDGLLRRLRQLASAEGLAKGVPS